MFVDITSPHHKYDIIYADPPWPQTKSNKCTARPNQGKDLPYPTLQLPEIQRYLSLVNTSTKHNFFVWTIDKFLHETELMMNEIGYTLHARMIWDKGNGIAPAMTVRFSHEYLLWFYKRGCCILPCKEARGKYATVFRESHTVHSKKPQCAYDMINAMFPHNSKIELFARNTYQGLIAGAMKLTRKARADIMNQDNGLRKKFEQAAEVDCFPDMSKFRKCICSISASLQVAFFKIKHRVTKKGRDKSGR